MTIERFGRIGDADVLEVTIASKAGAEARILTWGAVVRDLVVPDGTERRHVALGLNTIEDYVARSPYFGAVVGRCGNRIGGARFTLDGETYRLVPNENGNQLHGGPEGFGRRLWSLVSATPSSATLALVSDDGDMGYPGRLVALCTYAWREPATFAITLEAIADRPTPVNLTTHGYFNLDGSPDIFGHQLAIAADFVTPTDAEKIPTGEIRPVAGTPYDFREARRIGPPDERGGLRYDINYVLRHERGALAHAATLSSERSHLAMDLWTTEPGLQFYDGHLVNLAVPGIEGRVYGPCAGLCLEPQFFPDGPNKPFFPHCILRPGEVSRQATELRFRSL